MAEIVKVEQRMSTLRQFFDQNKGKVGAVLPRHFSADRQGQLLFTMVYKNPSLLDCTPASLVGAIMQGGMLGLEPVGPGGYWLVPFYEKAKGGQPARRNVTMIIDYRGLMGMARRTKEVKVVDWREVRKGDLFEYEYGSSGFIKHKPSATSIHVLDEKGNQVEREITHCYAYGVLTSGATVFEVMTKADIEWHRDRYSRAAGNGPWVTNFAEMGAKTCVRRLGDKLPFDPLLSRGVEIDSKTEQGIGEDFGALLGEVAAEHDGDGKTESKLDKLTTELAKKPEGNGGQTTATTPEGGAEVATGVAAPPPASASLDTKGGEAQSSPATTAAPAAAPIASEKPASDVGGGGEGASLSPAVTQSIVVDQVSELWKVLGLDGDMPRAKGQRVFLWSRFVGDFDEQTAPLEKLLVLRAELQKLVAQKKGKK